MPKCWVSDCKEEPFLQVEEVWFEVLDEPNKKICSSNQLFNRESNPYLCYLHYISKSCTLATEVLNHAYRKGKLGLTYPDTWFVKFNGNYLVEGDVFLNPEES